MNIEHVKKYLQVYLDDVIIPQANMVGVGDEDEPLKITIDDIFVGELNPNRINFFLKMEPNWSKGSYTRVINKDIENFFKMLSIDKDLHIYWNKKPQV